MAIVPAFHSVKQNAPKVYHNNSACTEGNNIEQENKRTGTAGRPLCKNCRDLAK